MDVLLEHARRIAPISGQARCKITGHDKQIGTASRERWLAELGRALAEARSLNDKLSRSAVFAGESADIALWIDQAIAQVDWLRRGRPIAIADLLGPKWLGLSANSND